jgi:hypothetical protein
VLLLRERFKVNVLKKVLKYSGYGFLLLLVASASMMYMGGQKLRENRERLELSASAAGFASVEEYQAAQEQGYATKTEYDVFLEETSAAERVAAAAGGFSDIAEYRLAVAVGMQTKALYDAYLAQQTAIVLAAESTANDELADSGEGSSGAAMSANNSPAAAAEPATNLVLECTSAEGFKYFILHEDAETARVVNPPDLFMYPIRFETSSGYYTYSNADLAKYFPGLAIDYFHINRVDAELGFFSESSYGALGRIYSCVETSPAAFAAAEDAVADADARRAQAEEAEESRIKSSQKF